MSSCSTVSRYKRLKYNREIENRENGRKINVVRVMRHPVRLVSAAATRIRYNRRAVQRSFVYYMRRNTYISPVTLVEN